MQPYLFKTTDFGKTWKSLAAKLPQDVYLHVVREDPKHKGLLYARHASAGVAFSTDDGATWQQLKLNLPTVAVHDLVVKDNDLVVGTNGRSIWIFDDLTPDSARIPPDRRLRRLFLSRAAGGSLPLGQAAPPRARRESAGGRRSLFPPERSRKATSPWKSSTPRGAEVATLSSKKEPEHLKRTTWTCPTNGATILPTEPGLHRVVWDPH